MTIDAWAQITTERTAKRPLAALGLSDDQRQAFLAGNARRVFALDHR